MPRDIQAAMNRKEFVLKQQQKVRKPLVKKKIVNDFSKNPLFSSRSKRLAIRNAAMNKLQIVVVYRKTTTNVTKKYTVCPYSYRYKRLKVGTRKMLFAYDIVDKHIKQYALTNIKSVTMTTKNFSPKWPIEIR